MSKLKDPVCLLGVDCTKSGSVRGNDFQQQGGAANYKGTPVELMGWGISMGNTPWYTSDPAYRPVGEVCFRHAYEGPCEIGQ